VKPISPGRTTQSRRNRSGEIVPEPAVPSSSMQNLTPRRLRRVRKRIASGFYDQPEVIESILLRMVRDLGIHPKQT